ncbi:MAG: hypothetical protein MSH30_05060 [Campylobacter sp.]|uniref:hypothetical protein n=1 Tax=Campylobacter sp. TaxID=205 RepID=UPI002AA90BF7|nr:hypothetical protein [Campylobacter sp.]MCI6343597.1 hypothetical protein [Campylobacter sp.]MCI7362678.1 hypothetical protein [Campylobacter sp.]MCI7463824.1 hypothetical protein [Campylobacter sp.]
MSKNRFNAHRASFCVLILPWRPQNRTKHRKTTPQNRHAQKRSGERFFRPPFDPLRRQFISLSAKKIAFAFVLKPY